MAFADSKHLVAECTLAEVEVVRDEAFSKAASLESECMHLAQSVIDKADEMFGQAFYEKEGLGVELSSLKERFVELERALMQEWNQRATAQGALVEAKM